MFDGKMAAVSVVFFVLDRTGVQGYRGWLGWSKGLFWIYSLHCCLGSGLSFTNVLVLCGVSFDWFYLLLFGLCLV